MKKGSISFDFVFAFGVAILLILVFVMLTLSLCMMQVAQYVTYASARAYFVSDLSLEHQQIRAATRFARLKQKLFPRQLESWFEIVHNDEAFSLENHKETFPDRNLFVGVQAKFESKVFQSDFGFLGGKANTNFEASLSSYLGREVSQVECKNFFQGLYRAHLKSLFQRENGISINTQRTCPSGVNCFEC